MTEKTIIKIDGQGISPVADRGYFVITRSWKKGESLQIEFPMQVRKVETNAKVAENKGKLALEYGPVVYAVEEVDNRTISIGLP